MLDAKERVRLDPELEVENRRVDVSRTLLLEAAQDMKNSDVPAFVSFCDAADRESTIDRCADQSLKEVFQRETKTIVENHLEQIATGAYPDDPLIVFVFRYKLFVHMNPDDDGASYAREREWIENNIRFSVSADAANRLALRRTLGRTSLDTEVWESIGVVEEFLKR